MKKNNGIKDMIIIGFALFAMFFGSGNLIFPPYLGRLAGENYFIAIIGFMIMGVGLPLLGVMASAKADGNFENIGNRVGKTFSICLVTALILAIGPFLAIPRTAATTYEISVRPFLPHIHPVVVIGIYFAINLFFVLRPGSIIDVIGKFLTPVLLVILAILIVKGIVFPIGEVAEGTLTHVFSNSLMEGYQTMDALAAVCFGGIVVRSIKAKGYDSPQAVIRMTLKSSLVAIVGLGIIYGGLMYLGAHTSHMSGELEKTALVITLAQQILGQAGTVFLAIAVAVACLTTSIGLTSTGATYFSKLSKGRISYQTMAVIMSLVSMSMALLGVDKIIGVTTPVLNTLYPIIIVLVILALLGECVNQTVIYRVTVYTTLVIVGLDVMSQTIGITGIQNILGYLPLSEKGFGWVLPTLIAFIISKVLSTREK